MFCRAGKKIKKIKLSILVLLRFGYHEFVGWHAPLAQKHTAVQGSSGGESLATCVNLADSKIEPQPPDSKSNYFSS